MATEAITKGPILPQDIERVLIGGDLAKLTIDQRLSYYNSLCQSLGLNPMTRPFDYLNLNGKLVLYAKKDATEQLRKRWGVSVEEVRHDFKQELGLYVVTAIGNDATGRKDTGTGAVSVANLKGDALANAIMKAETKAKRRLTLSICGLGMLDETEIETIRGARVLAEVQRVSGELKQKKATEAGVVYLIGKTKCAIPADGRLDLDSLLAGADGKDVEVGVTEKVGPKGRYLEITEVYRIGQYDYEHAQEQGKTTLQVAGEQSLEHVKQLQAPEDVDALVNHSDIEAFGLTEDDIPKDVPSADEIGFKKSRKAQ